MEHRVGAIRNRQELLERAPPGVLRRRRATALDAVEAVLASVEPAAATRRVLNRWLQEGQPLRGCHLVAVGKAAVPMAQAAVETLQPQAGCGLALEPWSGGTVVLEAGGHPEPGSSAIAQGEEILSWAEERGPEDRVVALISGGASSLLVAPVPGLGLEDLQESYGLLVRSGAPIEIINEVRRRLSRVKGGGLLAALRPAFVATAVLSDTPGQPLAVVGSGPALPPTQGPPLAEFLARWERDDRFPRAVLRALSQTKPVPSASLEPPDLVACVADNNTAVEALCTTLRAAGVRCALERGVLFGEARVAGASWARRAFGSGRLWVLGGETTVQVEGDGRGDASSAGMAGRGGRGLEFVLGAAGELEPGGLVFSLATDGQDGNSGLAGALWDDAALAAVQVLGLKVEAALLDHDSASLIEALGVGLRTGPTGTNVADVAAILPARDEEQPPPAKS